MELRITTMEILLPIEWNSAHEIVAINYGVKRS